MGVGVGVAGGVEGRKEGRALIGFVAVAVMLLFVAAMLFTHPPPSSYTHHSPAGRRVMETRRGRCGEYSRLFFKAAEALRYRARWVVDWEVR